jgi:hypothetical protein
MTMSDPDYDFEAFFKSPSAAVTGASPDDVASIVRSFVTALAANDVRARSIDGSDIHVTVGHVLSAAFPRTDARSGHVIATVRAYLAWLDDRGVLSDGYEVRQSLENVAFEFAEAVRTGKNPHIHGHGHHHHGHGGHHEHHEGCGHDHHAEKKIVPATPKPAAGNIGGFTRKMRPNDLCFCGSKKKYKSCHGAV